MKTNDFIYCYLKGFVPLFFNKEIRKNKTLYEIQQNIQIKTLKYLRKSFKPPCNCILTEADILKRVHLVR